MSRARTPRAAILDAALRVLEEGDPEVLNMGRVAKLVGISRQALYLHFANRNELGIALARYSDEKYGTEEAVQPVLAATDGSSMLDALARFLSIINPRLYRVVRMADALRHRDEAFAKAWADRLASRRRGARLAAQRLADWRELSGEWSVRSAGDWLASMASARIYEEQVLELGVSLIRYRKTMSITFRNTLLVEPKGRGHFPPTRARSR